MSTILYLAILLIGVGVGYFIRHFISQRWASSLEKNIKLRLEEARSKEREIVLEAKARAVKTLEDAKQEESRRFEEVRQREDRLLKREENFDHKERELERERVQLENNLVRVRALKEELAQSKLQEEAMLQQISRLSKDEAVQLLLERIEREYRQDLIEQIRKVEMYRKEEIEKRALDIVVSSLQRYARSHISEVTTTTVTIPNEEMKGRLIGKEGRNIRHFEIVSGVELLIDETPGVVTLSSFDPIRREIARGALERLIKDGRIHPAKIEEELERAKQEIQEKVKTVGENAVYELGILDLPPQIIHLMGRLHFRTSYGQNVLVHSIEVASLSSMIADELGVDREVAKRAGFLHDIGKSVDHEIEGSHLEIGIKILQKYGVDEKITLAMRSHHETYPFATPEAYIVLAADVLSASRPGARSESIEHYLKRLADLERLAFGFGGIEKAYAISGGRELRVFVVPQDIDDVGMAKLARDVASKIENELRYPGEIKVVVIRENRAVEYAR